FLGSGGRAGPPAPAREPRGAGPACGDLLGRRAAGRFWRPAGGCMAGAEGRCRRLAAGVGGGPAPGPAFLRCLPPASAPSARKSPRPALPAPCHPGR
ncbi:MAG TPA: hypothetical protein VIL16_26470, partial [Trebonia sp.]